MIKKIKVSLMISVLAVLSACSEGDKSVANPDAGEPTYSEDVLIDEIEVFTDSSACARLLDKRIICSEYPASLGTRSLLRLTPSVACQEEDAECRGSVTGEELTLLSSIGDGASTLAGSTPLGCVKPTQGNGMICWGGEATRAPEDLSYFGDECLDGACDVVCGQWQGQSGCWGHWILRDHEVLKFDGACALLSDGNIQCPEFFGVDSGINQLAQELVSQHGAALDLRILPNHGSCIINSDGQVHCNSESGEDFSTQFSQGESYTELIGNPASPTLCARRESDKKVECVGVHPFLSVEDKASCENTPNTCPMGKSDEALSSVKLGTQTLCGLNDTGLAVCYFSQELSVTTEDDPFDYRDRINDDGELLRNLTQCEANKCISAEVYTSISLNRGITHSVVDVPVLIGCAITTKSRPHCFGMYTSGAPSCSWWDDDGCHGRIF
jgi:hypothetical protein